MIITFLRIAKTGSRNFMRNAWLSTAATAVMTVTLTLVTVSYITTTTLNTTIKGVVQKIDISIFLKDTATPDQINALKAKFLQQENTKEVVFITKSDALKEYREQNKDNPKLLQAVTDADNPLPASLRIKTKDPNKLAPITDLTSQPDVKALLAERDAVSYSGDRKATIDKIISTSNFIKIAAFAASIIFVIISTLIIFNTIRMAIFTRREEIEIMKLVGATNWYIRGPFIFEASLYGIIAAALSMIFVYTVVLGAAPKLGNYVDVDSIIAFMKSNVILVAFIELAIGVTIGVASSLVALKRYLKLT